MSSLRGQIHDENGQELRNYTIERVTFPRVFDIEIPYVREDLFFGPEDPRVVMDEEEKVIVVFNMISDVQSGRRRMFLFRPFEGKLTRLKVRGREERRRRRIGRRFFTDQETGRGCRTGSCILCTGFCR